jgi:DNA-binding NtrC family response regulator
MAEWRAEDLPPTDAPSVERGPVLPPRLSLVAVSGPDRGRKLELTVGTHVVGKSAGCALVLTDGAVSRRHLEIVVTSDAAVARDLGSRNGSFFHGARFSELAIGAGALIAIGDTELKVVSVAEHAPLGASQADQFGGLIGSSLRMREVYAVLERIAPSDIAVLIEGETGTGKELVAEAIHQASPRANKPFVVCDLAAAATSLLESELFGHVRGAFTGADGDRAGAFTQADGGTIFIDEVGEVELAAQPRLLRALEQRKVKPVGAQAYRPVNVRVIAATHRDLRAEVAAGRFRADLYHRLAIVRVTLPALRDRKEDLPRLVSHFLSERSIDVPQETLRLLAEYDWPGNVRELRNVIDRACSLLGDSRTLSAALLGLSESIPLAAATADGAGDGYREAKDRLLAVWERQFVLEILRRAGGNVSLAAREGKIDRGYLHRLMKKHGIRDQ